MAIKDHWNRMLRKSFSSSSSSSAGDRSTSPLPDDGTGSLSKPTSRLAKTLTWRSSGPGPKSPTAPTKKKKKPVQLAQSHFIHPSERGLTEANLRHQELLSGFTMKFGRRRTSAGGRTSFSGISPGNSRQASIDASYAPHHHGAGHHSGFDERRISSLVNHIPQEDVESQ